MERLTIPDVRVDEHTTRRSMVNGVAVREHAMEIYWRLKAYEDTGLTPEEVAAAKMALMGKTLAEITEFEGVPIARLRALAEADKDGRCVVLPCKVGDTVYQLRRKTHARVVDISPRIVSSACVWKDGSYALTHQGMLYCQSGDLGKTWFLTREEAERALQEMEGKKDGDETSL